MRRVEERPETSYALTPDGESIAHQVCGRVPESWQLYRAT
jgi:hypothetical protein